MPKTGFAVEIATTFETETCCNCGIAFAMTTEFVTQRRRDHGWFYCPAGHQQHYVGESEEQRLRRELEESRQATARARERVAEERALRDRAERRRAAAKGQLTKTLNRIKAGVCANCNERFPNVEEHMATEHPYEPAATLADVEATE